MAYFLVIKRTQCATSKHPMCHRLAIFELMHRHRIHTTSAKSLRSMYAIFGLHVIYLLSVNGNRCRKWESHHPFVWVGCVLSSTVTHAAACGADPDLIDFIATHEDSKQPLFSILQSQDGACWVYYHLHRPLWEKTAFWLNKLEKPRQIVRLKKFLKLNTAIDNAGCPLMISMTE